MDEREELIYSIAACSKDELYDRIINDNRYKCAEGLHSTYNETHFEPAIIKQTENGKVLFWLFDGDILDCDHPFCIVIEYGKISEIKYYSTERKNAGKPNSYKVLRTKFSMFSMLGIFSDQPPCDYKTDMAGLTYTPEFYPLYDQMVEDTVRFKFAD